MGKITKYEKAGDNLDRYRQHLIEGTELSEKYKAYFEKLEYANSLLCQGYSESNVAAILKSGKKFNDVTQSYGIIRDAKAIWGDVKKASKDGQRHVAYENFIRLARKAEQAGNLELASANYEKAAKLYGLFDSDESNIDINKFMSPVSVFFSSNPKFLMKDSEIIDEAE